MISVPYTPTTLANWYTAVMTNYPEGASLHRRQHVHVGIGR